MYVCICQQVKEQELRDEIEKGCNTMDALQHKLGIAQKCGQCLSEAQAILEQTQQGLLKNKAIIHKDRNRQI